MAALTAYHPRGWTDQTGQARTRTRVHIPMLICFNQGHSWLILTSIFFLITDIVLIALHSLYKFSLGFLILFQVLFTYFYWAKYSWQPSWSGIERFSFAQKSPHRNPNLRFRFRSNRVWIGFWDWITTNRSLLIKKVSVSTELRLNCGNITLGGRNGNNNKHSLEGC